MVLEAARLVEGLFDVLWAARSAGEKMDTFAAIESLKSTLDAVGLAVLHDFEATRGPEELGWASTRDFATAVSGGHKGSGPAAVRLAEAFQEPVMAPVAEALRDGWLSTLKAQLIERLIQDLPSSAEVRHRGVQVMLDEAKRLDASDLRKAGRRLVEVVDPDGAERREEKALHREERSAHLNRHLAITDDGAGGRPHPWPVLQRGCRHAARDAAPTEPAPAHHPAGLSARHLRSTWVRARRP